MPKPQDDTYKVITEGTFAVPLIPTIAFIGTLLVGAVTATLWITTTLGDIRSNLHKAISNRWSADHQREYSHQLQQLNPSVKVPDPDAIKRTLDTDR